MTIPSTTRRAGPFYGPLASGVQIPLMAAGSTIQFQVTCTVQ